MKSRGIEWAARVFCAAFFTVSGAAIAYYLWAADKRRALEIYLAGAAVAVSLLFMLRRKRKEQRPQLLDELNTSMDRIRQIKLQKRQEQLNALQSQINPHFLYNTLDTIRGLAIERESTDIANIVEALASMFKYSMDYSSTSVTLNDEIAHIEQYIRIQKMRFPVKFEFEQVLECEYGALFRVSLPKLTLQPIVENAVSHGLKNVSGGGRIQAKYTLTDHGMEVNISDNGCGIPEEMVLALNRSFRISSTDRELSESGRFGIALSNIDLRLKMYCGEGCGLHITSTPGFGTNISVTLPPPVGDM